MSFLENIKNQFNHAKVDIVLTALVSQFEKLYNGENFTALIELIPRILECVNNETK